MMVKLLYRGSRFWIQELASVIAREEGLGVLHERQIRPKSLEGRGSMKVAFGFCATQFFCSSSVTT